MKNILFISLLLWGSTISAQNSDPKLPTVLPPSPEAAAITKNAELNAGSYNGAVTTSIPLGQIKLKETTLPISLEYSSTGTKVDEIPSRAGMNWSLSAGGVITRIVNGKPDDLSTRYLPTEPLGTSYNSIAYYNNLTNESYPYDAEPDEFRVAAPGLSCKFVLDINNNPIIIPYSNIKIEIKTLVANGPYNEIIVTNTEGVKYYFGGAGAVEVTTNHSIGGKLNGLTQINTGFFLKKIQQLNRDSISFFYSVLPIQLRTGVTNTVVVSKGLVFGAPCGPDKNSAPMTCPIGNTNYSASVSDVRYNSLLLDSIKSSNNGRVLFTYENRNDVSSDKRISGVNIYEGINIKKYVLLYEDPTTNYYPNSGAGTINKRFFLKELQMWGDKNSVVTDTLKHKFSYNNITALPDRLSYAQDHYGYFNGKTNTNLLPAGYGSSDYSGYAAADRESDGNYAKIGMLNKVTYPTGGNDSIIYQSNGYYTVVGTPLSYTANVAVYGDGEGPAGVLTFLSDTMPVKRNHTAMIYMTASQSSSCTSCLPPSQGVDRIVDVRIKNITDNTFHRRILYTYSSVSESYTFLANKVYQIEMRVLGDYSSGVVEVNYDSSATVTYSYTNVWHEMPGISVAELRSFDPVAKRYRKRCFKYTSLDNLSGTSALPLYGIKYNSTAYNVTTNCFLLGEYFVCGSDVLTSNSNAYQYFYDNNVCAFTSVIESDDPAFKNGLIEHNYAAESFDYTTTILGDEIAQMPVNTNSWYHAKELSTKYYDSTLFLQKAVYNYYHVDTSGQKSRTGIIVRRKYDWILPPPGPVYQSDINPYDVGVYTYESRWIRQDSVVTIEFDKNGNTFTTKVSYNYGLPVNTQPINVLSTNSKGEVIKSEMKYPTDYTGQAPYLQMINNNLISPVVETKSYVSTNLIKTVKTNFGDYSVSPAINILPQTVEVKIKSEPSEIKLRFHKYDSKGNSVEISKENDIKLTYIWDYSNEYPIAEAMDADSVSTAYSSFEADGKGNFSFSGTPSVGSAITGRKAYDLNGANNITKSGLVSGNIYLLSYWTKNSTAFTISGTQSGYPKSGRTVNGWKYFEHKISGQTSLTLSGTGRIDELRLGPLNSQMKTYTYDPFIGVTSICDANNRINYYEYDGLNRLTVIRDQDSNIVKKICYNYEGQANDCLTNSPRWQNTSTAIRCKKNGSNQNTGEQEQEQKDVNPNSSTYNQLRWIVVGTNLNSCPTTVTIYARIEYSDWYYDVTQIYATTMIKFYSDASCTIPVSVSNLSINYNRVKTLCSGGTSTTNYTLSCSGTQASLGTQLIVWDDGGSNCYDYYHSVTAGTGYTPSSTN